MSKDAVDRSATPITLADVRAMQWLQRGLTHYLHRVEAPDVDELVVEVDDLCSAIVDSWERGDPSTLDHVQAFITRALSIRTQPVFVLMGFHGAILFEDDEHGYFEFDSPEMARDKVLEILDLCRETGVPVNLEFEISSLKILGARFPEILAQIRKAIHAGLAEIINTTYAHPYLHLVGAESNIRQFEYGGALFTEMFGCRPKVYVCSEFALHPQIPQILRFAGIEFASLRSRLSGNGPSAPYPIIEWEGLDGTCVGGLAHQTNHFVGEYYASVFYKEIFSQLVQAKMGPNRKYVVMSALVDHTVQMEDDVQEAYRVSRFGAVLGRHMTYTQLRNEGPEPAGICRFAYDQFEATRVPNQQGEGLGRRIQLACAALERRLLQVEDLLSRLTFTGNDISACLPPLGDVWRDLLLAQNHDSYTVPYHRPGEFHRHRLHLNPAEFGPYIDKIPLDGPRIGDRTLGLISRATAQLEEIVDSAMARVSLADSSKQASTAVEADDSSALLAWSIDPSEGCLRVSEDGRLNLKLRLLNPDGQPVALLPCSAGSCRTTDGKASINITLACGRLGIHIDTNEDNWAFGLTGFTTGARIWRNYPMGAELTRNAEFNTTDFIWVEDEFLVLGDANYYWRADLGRSRLEEILHERGRYDLFLIPAAGRDIGWVGGQLACHQAPEVVWPVGDALRSQRWTPSFGQPGSDVRVDSMRLSMLPCAIWSIPPLAFCRA